MLDQLGRAIVTGRYDNERFPTEDELTARYAVSRTVTREAVKMLTAKGLLKRQAARGHNGAAAVGVELLRSRRAALAARA